MAIREIVKIGDEILRKRSREVTEFDGRLHALIDDMLETLDKANGAGLAAVQVGVLRRVVVIDVGDGPIELVNPTIISCSGSVSSDEGCLSIPGRSEVVERPKKVKVSAFDRYGKQFSFVATDYFARAVCHEMDHLNGVLFIDHIERSKD